MCLSSAMISIIACRLRRSGALSCHSAKEASMADKIVKSDAEWQAQLTPEQYRIARKKGTERAFTGEYWNEHRSGTYTCVCCGPDLFASDTKFERGTGWPGFY